MKVFVRDIKKKNQKPAPPSDLDIASLYVNDLYKELGVKEERTKTEADKYQEEKSRCAA